MFDLLNNFVYSKNHVYKDVCRLYQYNDNCYRLLKMKCRQKGFEDLNKEKNILTVTDKKEIDRVSISRSRRMIRELALCNEFEYFVTLTVSSESCDRFSLDDCQKRLKSLLKKVKLYNKDFAYLIITEKHKNRCFSLSWSYETVSLKILLVTGFNDIYVNNFGYLSHHYFDKLRFQFFFLY